MGVWGGWEPGAEGSMGRKGALGGPTDRRGFQPALAPNVAYCGLEKAVPSAASGAISVVVDELLQVILVFAVDTFHPQPR